MSKQLTAALIAASVAELPAGHITMPHNKLGGDINIKIMSVAEREDFEKVAFGADSEFKDYPQRAVTFAHAVVDEKGERLFGDDQIPVISKWPAYITVPVFQKYNEINGLGPEKVEAATKNS
jgi:hypothetical protein